MVFTNCTTLKCFFLAIEEVPPRAKPPTMVLIALMRGGQFDGAPLFVLHATLGLLPFDLGHCLGSAPKTFHSSFFWILLVAFDLL